MPDQLKVQLDKCKTVRGEDYHKSRTKSAKVSLLIYRVRCVGCDRGGIAVDCVHAGAGSFIRHDCDSIRTMFAVWWNVQSVALSLRVRHSFD